MSRYLLSLEVKLVSHYAASLTSFFLASNALKLHQVGQFFVSSQFVFFHKFLKKYQGVKEFVLVLL